VAVIIMITPDPFVIMCGATAFEVRNCVRVAIEHSRRDRAERRQSVRVRGPGGPAIPATEDPAIEHDLTPRVRREGQVPVVEPLAVLDPATRVGIPNGT
jgi:hypothetical protein